MPEPGSEDIAQVLEGDLEFHSSAQPVVRILRDPRGERTGKNDEADENEDEYAGNDVVH